MLKSLSINNIVLIDKAEIEFSRGLCVLSGETGSGKSILLDALGLAIGFRSTSRLIGSDENRAAVSAEFDLQDNQLCQSLLKEHELLDVENPSNLRIRRVISENSSSKVYVNDVAVGVNLLAQIGENLLEIHGQHDSRGLLNPSFHGQILDEFAGNQKLLSELRQVYDSVKETDEKIAAIKAKKEQAERERDYLEFIINELSEANIKSGEEAELVTKKDQLQSKEKILGFLSELKNNLTEANSHLSLSQRILLRNQKLIDSYLPNEQEELEKLNEKIDAQNSEIEAAISSINKVARELNNGNESLEEIEERLFLIRSLARKFSVTSDELPQVISDAEEKLELLKNEKQFSEKLEEEKNQLLKKYDEVAKKLSARRAESAKVLSTKVETELKFLKMEGTKFNITLTPSLTPSPTGSESIRFTASINKTPFDDISKIASGGELSRFMLALKVALMDVRSTPTMIFDEIDTGIGGSTADAVGKRLKILSQKVQILVVTHQPQIAAKADTHFKISKTSDDKKVKTVIQKLDKNDREQEIARMLSGEKISSEALAAAASLLNES